MTNETKQYNCTVELNIFEDTDKATIETLELALERAIHEYVDRHECLGTSSARTGNFYLAEE